jgi:hypothetical protein
MLGEPPQQRASAAADVEHTPSAQIAFAHE